MRYDPKESGRESQTPAGSLNTRRTRRREAPASKKQLSRSDKRLVQLVSSAVILGIVVLMKLTFPEGSDALRGVLSEGISGNLDYKSALEAMGRVVSGGGDISEVFSALVEEDTPANNPEEQTWPPVFLPVAADAGASPTPSLSPDASPVPSAPPNTPPPPSAAPATPAVSAAPAGSKAESAAKINVGEVLESGDLLAAPKSIPLSAAEIEELSFAMTPEETDDDTPATEFVIPPPDRVDMSRHILNFKCTTPAKGRVSSKFGYRDHPLDSDTKFHYGLDIAAPRGSDILCFADGVVESAGVNSVYGNLIRVKHVDGYLSFYGHCSKFYIKTGDKVKMGQKIAAVGATGQASGPHLHFELRLGSAILDPTYYISP